MSDSERSTKVKVEPELKFGEFANAFRVVDEIGEDCFLDFLVYSKEAEEAIVVSRVRVRRDFLSAIRDRLEEAVDKFDGADASETSENTVFRKSGETVH